MGYLLLGLIYLSHNTLAHIYTLTFTNVDSHMLRFSKSDNLAVFWQKENQTHLNSVVALGAAHDWV